MGRAPCCSKVGLHRGAWTPREDTLLTNYIQLHGEGHWRCLPKKAGLMRCGKSCRLRWKNYLRPDIKRGNITADEDDLIIRMHALLGNRWSLIAGRLPGRTDNEIKNYYVTHLSKKLRTQGTDPISHKRLSDHSALQQLNNKTAIKANPNKKPKLLKPQKLVVHNPKAVRFTCLQSLPSTDSFGDTIENILGEDNIINGSDFEVCQPHGPVINSTNFERLYEEYFQLVNTNYNDEKIELDWFVESLLL